MNTLLNRDSSCAVICFLINICVAIAIVFLLLICLNYYSRIFSIHKLHSVIYSVSSFFHYFFLSFRHPFSHSSILSLIRPSSLSFIHPFFHSSINSLIHPSILLFIHPFSHSSTHSLIHPSILSFIHPFSHSFIHPFFHSSIHPIVHKTSPFSQS